MTQEILHFLKFRTCLVKERHTNFPRNGLKQNNRYVFIKEIIVVNR
jgi:hypothetical protein